MFLSDVFTESFVNTLNVPGEMYNCDGSVRAVFGAGLGAGIYKTDEEVFQHFKPVCISVPKDSTLYNDLYAK